MEEITKKFIHDMNNKMSQVISSAQLLLMNMGNSEERAKTILESSIEASEIVSKYSRDFNLYYNKEE